MPTTATPTSIATGAAALVDLGVDEQLKVAAVAGPTDARSLPRRARSSGDAVPPDADRTNEVPRRIDAAAQPSSPEAAATAGTPADLVDLVDQAGMDSFPASDPPSFWTHDPAPRR